MEKRIEELELIIKNLDEQVRRNYVILNGDSEIAFSSGVLSRLNVMEAKFDEQATLIQSLTDEIIKQNEKRDHERKLREAREDERANVINNMERWVKIIGPLFIGGSGLQLFLEVQKLINGG